jgi:hypothetical protein
MSSASSHAEYSVKILLQAVGPVRHRTKCKKHKLMWAEGSITLPYPGLYLTFSKPRARGEPTTSYLRVRGVEWS